MKQKEIHSRNRLIKWFGLVIFLIPIIVMYKNKPINTQVQMYFANQTSINDFFLYYKVVFFQLSVIILFVSTIVYKLRKGWRFKWDMFTSLLFSLLLIIVTSFLFSKYKYTAFWGYPERYDGTITWICYILLSYSVYLVVEDFSDVQFLLKSYVFSVAIVCIIGVFQFLGVDFFQSEFGKMLYLGNNYSSLADFIYIRFPKGVVYSTLYNPNYVGTMIAISLPILINFLIISSTKVLKVFYAGIIIVNVVALIGSKSTGGLIATVTVSIIYIGYYFIKGRNYKKKKTLFFLVVSIGLCVIILYGMPTFERQFQKISMVFQKDDLPVFFEEIQIEDSKLTVTSIDNDHISMEHDNGSLNIYNESGLLMDATLQDDGNYVVDNSSMPKWNVQYLVDVHKVKIGYKPEGEKWPQTIILSLVEDGYSIFGPKLTNENITPVNAQIFRNERSFSKRGFIWNRSLPLVKERILTGYGADVFPLIFPQNDILGKISIQMPIETVVDKPHSYFVGVVMNFGIFAILIQMFMMIFPLLKRRASVIYMMPIIGFLISGIVNDSLVFLTYMFFVLYALHFKHMVNNQEAISNLE